MALPDWEGLSRAHFVTATIGWMSPARAPAGLAFCESSAMARPRGDFTTKEPGAAPQASEGATATTSSTNQLLLSSVVL